MAKNKGGRPTKLDPITVKKLEEVFAMDGSVKEACFYADISTKTYYEWLKKNPELGNRFDALRQKPVLIARQTIFKDLKDDVTTAKWYVERKRRNEFAQKTIQEHEGKIEQNVTLDDKRAEELASEYEEKYKKDVLGLDM